MPDVELVRNAESPIAVIATTTTWEDLPVLWPRLLDEVWAELRRHHATTGHNVMVYEGVPLRVQIGVEVADPIEPAGRVIPSTLPAGRTARALHTGSPATISQTHDAVAAWCARHGHETTGLRWEIYGDPDADGSFSTEVHWQVPDLG